MSGGISPGGCNDCNGEDIVLSRRDLEDDNVQQMNQSPVLITVPN